MGAERGSGALRWGDGTKDGRPLSALRGAAGGGTATGVLKRDGREGSPREDPPGTLPRLKFVSGRDWTRGSNVSGRDGWRCKELPRL